MSGICWCFIVTRQVFSKRWFVGQLPQGAVFVIFRRRLHQTTRFEGCCAVSIERTVSGVRCTNDNLKPVLVALATDQPLDGDGRENGQNRTLSMRPVRLRP
ncbi:hypothetical protein D0X26_28865 [Escherichia coli]|nr:hypothetical protein D0X26_28865 [Escherichia coli]